MSRMASRAAPAVTVTPISCVDGATEGRLVHRNEIRNGFIDRKSLPFLAGTQLPAIDAGPQTARARGSCVTVKIGINPNTWTLDDVPELKHFTGLKDFLREAAECGYAGIEMGGLFPRSSAELRPLLV